MRLAVKMCSASLTLRGRPNFVQFSRGDGHPLQRRSFLGEFALIFSESAEHAGHHAPALVEESMPQ
jgi:hypothetical protein